MASLAQEIFADRAADALAVVVVVAEMISFIQARPLPGAVAARLQPGANFDHVEHQRARMVSAQLNIGVGEALVRLRAYPYADDRPSTEDHRRWRGQAHALRRA